MKFRCPGSSVNCRKEFFADEIVQHIKSAHKHLKCENFEEAKEILEIVDDRKKHCKDWPIISNTWLVGEIVSFYRSVSNSKYRISDAFVHAFVDAIMHSSFNNYIFETSNKKM